MPHEHLLFRSEAREKVLRGATAIVEGLQFDHGFLSAYFVTDPA